MLCKHPGKTNLQLAVELTDAGGIHRIKEGDPLQVASWYQACFDAGLPVTVQQIFPVR
nr:Hypothetical protein [Raoultella ornithinolytica]